MTPEPEKSSKLTSFLRNSADQMISRLVPGRAEKRIDELLFIPKARTQTVIRVPKEFQQYRIKTRDGNIQAYRTGVGPVVVFVHGWGGAAQQFFALMRGLSRCGFSALAFDQLGHGQSDEKQATLEQSISTLNHVLHLVKDEFPEGLAAVVGHSTGCIAIAAADPVLIKNHPLLLISPVFNYQQFFVKRLSGLKLPARLIQQYATHFSKAYPQQNARLELTRNLEKYNDVTVIAHDNSDTECPVADSIQFCNRHPLTKLLLTRDYDHYRIVNSESLWQELKSVLNYEDTTINFTSKLLDQ